MLMSLMRVSEPLGPESIKASPVFLLAVALGRTGPEPCLGKTVELALMSKELVSQP